MTILFLVGCTTPASVDYQCVGGRKIAVETQHGLAMFGVEIIGTRHHYEVVGTCDQDVDVEVGPKR